VSRRGQVALAAGVACLALVCALGAGRPGVVAAQAKAYSWVDASGRLRISDRPPPTGADEADVVVIRRGNGLGGPDAAPEDSLPPKDAGPADGTGDDPMEPVPVEEKPPVEAESRAGDEAQAETSGDAQAEVSGDVKPSATDEADETEEVSPQPRSVEERIRAWRRRAAEARRGAASSMTEEGAPATRSQRRRGAEQPEDDDPEGVEGEEAPRPWWEL